MHRASVLIGTRIGIGALGFILRIVELEMDFESLVAMINERWIFAITFVTRILILKAKCQNL